MCVCVMLLFLNSGCSYLFTIRSHYFSAFVNSCNLPSTRIHSLLGNQNVREYACDKGACRFSFMWAPIYGRSKRWKNKWRRHIEALQASIFNGFSIVMNVGLFIILTILLAFSNFSYHWRLHSFNIHLISLLSCVTQNCTQTLTLFVDGLDVDRWIDSFGYWLISSEIQAKLSNDRSVYLTFVVVVVIVIECLLWCDISQLFSKPNFLNTLQATNNS